MQANQPIESQQAKLRIARMFDILDGVSGLCPYGSGHINDTYLGDHAVQALYHAAGKRPRFCQAPGR